MLAALLPLLCLAGLATAPDLTTAQSVRGLPVADAKAGRTVRVDGVVTFAPRRDNYFHIQDGTGGVRVEWARDRDLRTGQRVTVIGTTAAGTFLPEIKAAWVLPIGEPGPEHLPRVVEYALALDDSGYLDGRWVSVEAVVQRVWAHDGWLKYDLVRGRGNAVAYAPRPDAVAEKDAMALAGAVVTLRGVCRAAPNAARQPAGPPQILVNGPNAIRELPGRRRDLAKFPPVSVRDLSAFRPDPIEARLPVRLDGVVTLNQGGRQLYVGDDTGTIMVISIDAVSVKTGDRVRVSGFPRASDPLRLENARVEARGPGPLPAAQPGTPAAAGGGRLEGHVVKFVGTVHEAGRQGEWMTLTVLADGRSFTAVLLDSRGAADPPPAPPGSTVEVVGAVTRLPLDGIRATAFVVAVRPGGLNVLAVPPAPPPPPWWTGRRVAYLSTAVLGLALLGGGAVTALRVQVRRATALATAERAEKARLAGRLEQASRLEAIGLAAGGVAHDFNNILTVINGCAQLLDEELSADPARAATLAADIRRAGRLAATLNALLMAFSRQRAVAPHPLDVDAVVADAAPVLGRLLPRGCVFRVTATPGLPPVRAETGLLLQVLINLAVNAGEAMPGGGTFALATSAPEPGWVRVTATDTGAGMTADVRARVFDRGYTTKRAGTGTGLSTVADVARALGGRVRVRSEVGRGTEFEIDLPAAPPSLPPRTGAQGAHLDRPTAPARLDDTRDAAPLPPGGPVVLVVDDDSVRAFACLALERAGFAVLAAADAEAALALLAARTGPVDVLLTDLTMPGMGGTELAARVRAERPGVRVLFASGDVPDADDPRFLSKPFTAAQLAERVGGALGQAV